MHNQDTNKIYQPKLGKRGPKLTGKGSSVAEGFDVGYRVAVVGGGGCHRETNFAQTSTPNLILRVMSVPVDCQVTPCALTGYSDQLSVLEEADRKSTSDQCSTCSTCLQFHNLIYFSSH